MYHTDPSGTYLRFEAWAIGAGSEGAQSLLQEKYSKDMSLADAEVLALSTLKQVCAASSLCCKLCFRWRDTVPNPFRLLRASYRATEECMQTLCCCRSICAGLWLTAAVNAGHGREGD